MSDTPGLPLSGNRADSAAPARLADPGAGLDVYRTLFAAHPDALIVADALGSIVMANPAAASLLGYANEELVGMSVDALVPDSIRPRHASYRDAYALHPRPRPMGNDMDLVAKRRDGSEVLVEIALSPLQSHGLPYVVASIRDVAAYPRVKQALRRARYGEHLAQLGRLAVDARDAEQLVQQVPAIAAQALQVEVSIVFLLEPDKTEFRVAGGVGLIDGETVGMRVPNGPRTPPGFVVAEGRPVVIPDYRQERRFDVPQAYLEAGLVSALAVPLIDRGRAIGALTTRSREVQRFGDDEVRFLQSLSTLLSTSLQRAQSEDALKHAQRLESVGQLTGGIAHDFNNLLTIIQGNLQVLQELPALQGQNYPQQLVDAALRASRRGAELTGKLLAFSRRQVLQPQAVDLKHMLASLSDMLRRTLDQRIRIEVGIVRNCPSVQADPGQLESALLNIAINARDAMPEGGLLRFIAVPCDSLPRNLRDGLDDPSTRDDAFVAISVIDTGIGMPDAVKERAFEPFFTTKEAGRGTGLGLSTVYGFVKQSRGAISIDSTPGKGTTITLYIPRISSDAPAVTEDDSDGEPLAPGLRVLLVEDDPEVRRVVRSFLDVLQCKVTESTSGEQAMMALTSAASNDFDLLLSDIALGPGMRGTQLARHAQERFADLAVLLMSGFSSDLLQADREAPPTWELLRKPYTRDELARAIGRAIRTRR